MNVVSKMFFLTLIMMNLSVNAEVITVNFKSVVDDGYNSPILLGETINISLTYDTSTSFDGMYYFDTSTSSNITATFENGLVIESNPSSNIAAKVEIENHSPRIAINPDIYTHYTQFNSPDAVSNVDSLMHSLVLIVANPVNTEQYGILRTSAGWDENVSKYTQKEFNFYSANSWVGSTITEISVIPASPITVEVTTSSHPAIIPTLGGSLSFNSDIENTSSNDVEIKHWAYITWPNGRHYNLDTPQGITLNSNQNIQPSASFTLPPYWPAGTYKYHLNSIVVEDNGLGKKGVISKDSFTFIKEE